MKLLFVCSIIFSRALLRALAMKDMLIARITKRVNKNQKAFKKEQGFFF